MKKTFLLFELTHRQYWRGIVLVIFVAAVLRFYKLGEVPHGMYWDEAAIGYNGYAILTTRRDEWLERLPASFRSFDDYKAPLAIYMNGLFTYFFGMNLFAVRLPFALAGVGAVLGMIYLVRLVSFSAGISKKQARMMGLSAGALTALSPWHLHFSRIGFESGLAVACFIWGLYFFHKALAVAIKWRQIIDFTLAVLLFIASLYAYHSSKLVVPLAGLWLVIAHRKALLSRWKQWFWSIAVGMLAMWPLLKDAVFGHGLDRSTTFFFAWGYTPTEMLSLFAKNVASHFSLDFLILGGTFTLRHSDGQWGVLLPTTMLLVVVCLISAWVKKSNRTHLLRWSVGLVLLGLLPATLGVEAPHGNRALLALPGFMLLAVQGLRYITESNLKPLLKKSILGSLILFHGLFFVSYLHHYYTRFAALSATDFQDGYLETFRLLLPYERGEEGHVPVDKIIFTSDYGQPYIYALFARKTNPIWYHGGSLIKYEFKDEITVGDLERKNTAVVASMYDDLLGQNDKAEYVVAGSDGLPRFRIYIQP